MGVTVPPLGGRDPESVSDPVALIETRVAIAGDWHSSRSAARAAMRLVHSRCSDVHTILHLGDFNLGSGRPWAAYKKMLAETMAEFDIHRILVTPGNHDDWGHLSERFAAHPNTPYRLPNLEEVSFLPRGYRFSLAGRTFLSFGGAASPDQEKRVRGKDWWPEEEPSRAEATRAVELGPPDVMLSHEAVNGGTARVEHLIAHPRQQLFTQLGLVASNRTRALVTDVWDQVQAPLLFHGHMHVKDEIQLPDHRRIYSLAAGGSPGNVGILELETLSWTWLD
jgi:hypothetical protein